MIRKIPLQKIAMFLTIMLILMTLVIGATDITNDAITTTGNVSAQRIFSDFWTNVSITESQIDDLGNYGLVGAVNAWQLVEANITDLSHTVWCYQETANVSNNCGGLSTGTYELFTKDGTIYPAFMINYSKPASGGMGLWQVKHGDQAAYNQSIPQLCWDQNPLQFKIQSYFATGVSNTACFNGTTWQTLTSYTGPTCGGYNSYGHEAKLFDGDWGTWAKGAVAAGVTDWSDANNGGGCINASIYEEAMWWNGSVTYTDITITESQISDFGSYADYANVVNTSGDNMTSDLGMGSNGLGFNNATLTQIPHNTKIDGSVFAVLMTNPPNQELPHFILQSGGETQASVILRSLMIANEINDFHNETKRTDCGSYMTEIGETLKIDCNTTTTGADLLVSDDLQVVGDVWVKDSDGEWHFVTKTLEVLDTMQDNLQLNKMTGSITNNNVTVATASGDDMFINVDEVVYDLDRAEDSIILTEGTNATPVQNYVYYNGSGAPDLYSSTTIPSEEKVYAAQALMGANYSYGDIIGRRTSYEFMQHVYDDSFDRGAIYLSGFTPTASEVDINFSIGVMRVMLSKSTITTALNTSVGYFHVLNDGTFEQHTSLDGLSVYTSGEAIGNNKYFNLVCGVVTTEDGIGRMYCVTQNIGSVEYTSATNALSDVYDTKVYFPPNDFLTKISIPVMRAVAKNTGGVITLQTLPNGEYFIDIRGAVTSSAGSAPSPGITVHSDLTNLDYASAAHTGFASETNIQTMNDSITNVNVTVEEVSNKLDITNSTTNMINLLTASAMTFATVDTGFGANELYDMNQHVLTTSNVSFVNVTLGTGANTGVMWHNGTGICIGAC